MNQSINKCKVIIAELLLLLLLLLTNISTG